jgi:ferric-chelate reductase
MAPTFAAGSAGTSAQSQFTVDDEQLVYHIDLILLFTLAFFVLLRLPRFLARFWNFGDLLKGFVLRSGPTNRHPQRRVDFSYDPNSGLPQLASDDSHVMYLEKHHARRVGPDGAAVVSSYPPHVSSTPSFLRPTLHLFHRRLLPGVSFSHLSIMALYLGAWVYPAFYKTNAFTDPVRFGWIALAQYPWILIFAAKNNLLSFILGAGYEKVRPSLSIPPPISLGREKN